MSFGCAPSTITYRKLILRIPSMRPIAIALLWHSMLHRYTIRQFWPRLLRVLLLILHRALRDTPGRLIHCVSIIRSNCSKTWCLPRMSPRPVVMVDQNRDSDDEENGNGDAEAEADFRAF